MPTPDLRLAKAEWSAGKRVSGGSGRGDEAVLAQHFDPARRVALNVQRNAPRWIKMLRKHGFIATPAAA